MVVTRPLVISSIFSEASRVPPKRDPLARNTALWKGAVAASHGAEMVVKES